MRRKYEKDDESGPPRYPGYPEKSMLAWELWLAYTLLIVVLVWLAVQIQVVFYYLLSDG